MEKMELSEALKANASVLEELIPIANLESKGLLKKGVLSPILVCNKDSVQEVCVVRLASSSSAYIGMILSVSRYTAKLEEQREHDAQITMQVETGSGEESTYSEAQSAAEPTAKMLNSDAEFE